MSNDNQIIISDNFGPVAEAFKNSPVDPTRFTAGIGMAWPNLTLKGKTWGWRFRGESRIFDAPNPAAGGAIMPVQYLDVVLVDAGHRISKVFYKNGYDPQNPTRKPPDCWSVDGIYPDPTVSEKQNPTCGGCRHNVFGSNIGPAGQKGKACSDNKRLAVVTVNDLANADFGGPFMLRLPPGSFAPYTNYVSVMASRGYQPYTIVTRLMFDPSVAHPRVMFLPQRPLKPEEAVFILAHQSNPRTDQMLNDKSAGAFADPEVDGEGVIAPLPSSTEPNASSGGTSGWSATATPAADRYTPPPAEAAKMVAEAKETMAAPTPEEQIKILQAQVVAARKAAEPEPTTMADALIGQARGMQGSSLTPDQQQIRDLQAQLAAAQKATEPKPEPVPTPEQLQIKELQAQLAATKTAEAKPRGRPRSKPVGPPTGNETPTQASNGAAPSEDELAGNPVGNAIADRIAGLVKKNPA